MSGALAQLAGFTHFAQPRWLVAGVLALVLLPLAYLLRDRGRRRALAAFAVPREQWGTQVAPGLLWLRRLCLAFAVLCVCAALARPVGPARTEQEEGRGIDILFAIDTSRSMLTPDVRPDRLTRAKLAVEDLLDLLGGDSVGLVAFAGEAFLQAPLTTDYDAFRETLEALDTHTIALGGTDIAAAIRTAQAALAGRDGTPVLVLVTDGEDLDGEAVAAAEAAGKAGLRIYTVGVGTAAGELIPQPGGGESDRFVRDNDGNFVKSRLDEATLRRIAGAAGGTYQPLGAQGQGVVDLYRHTLSGLARHATAGRAVTEYAQLFQWPLGLAVLLLVLHWVVRPVRHLAPAGAGARAAPLRTAARNLGVAALPGLLLLVPPPAHAAQPGASYGEGARAYRGKDYEAAVKAYRDALRSADVQRQQDSYYNLGNALYRAGGASQGRDPQRTLDEWKQSIAAYDTALQLRPGDADAKFNRAVVQKRLDELQRQQQQHKQNQNQNQQDRNQDRQQNQDQSGQQDQPGQPDRQGQRKQDPQGDPQQSRQDNDPNGQGNRKPQQDPGSQPDRKPQQDPGSPRNQPPQPQQGGQQPRPQPAGGQPPSSGPQPGPDPGRLPDQMSREEAEHLLDSVRGQARHLAMGAANGKPDNRPVRPFKDW